jgi:hypothetical protein
MTEDCVFKNCEFYSGDVDGHCNGECCGGPAQEFCKWYKYLQSDREINIQREPKPAPDFNAIAHEIQHAICATVPDHTRVINDILRKHFGKEE